MKYKPVIGLEIHVELNTKTKMFCGCSADYWGKEPNTHTCPVCLGLPGALPFANREALENCIKIGLALNCEVSKDSKFERKNYFYPDLPKGYQISQYRWPMCKGGVIEVSDSQKKIRINRVHMEEDTAKLVHTKDGTGIDFNRSGVPLVEMVTEPDFENIEEVVEFAKNFQQIVKDLGVSNADMERGDLRLEANISLRDKSQVTSNKLPNYRIELKNINSHRFMAHALDHEIKRQTELLEQGLALFNETRGWDEDKKESYSQRSKEEAHDYRYFPEPDLPAVEFSDSDVQRIRGEMLELGSAKVERLVEKYKILQVTGRVLVSQGSVGYFEGIMKAGPGLNAQDVANAIVNKRIDTSLSPEEFVEKLQVAKGGSTITDEDLEIAVLTVIKHNESAVENYKKGNLGSLQFLVGQVMAKSQGRADPSKAREMINDKLQMINNDVK